MRYFIVIICILAADQGIKWIVTQNMSQGESNAVIEGILHMTYIRNHGAAFSFFQGHSQILGIVTAVFIAGGLVFIYVKRKTGERLMMYSAAMIVGGGAGNLVDRATMGYVVDYIDFRIFPVFNLADICVTVGCMLLCVSILKSGGNKTDG